MEQKEEKEIFETQDVHTAVFLKLNKVPFLGVRYENSGAYFQFSCVEMAKKMKEKYFKGGEVIALDFKNSIRDLTTLAKNR